MSIEIYVYSEGNVPKKVVQGRQEAVNLVTKDFHTTQAEKVRIRNFVEGNICELGTGLQLVGYPPEVPDRKLTRVLGPGSNE